MNNQFPQRIAAFHAIFIFCLIIFSTGISAQPFDGKRPKLVVGVVVDQMRWDYLYRYYDRYSAGGFKRLIGQGFSSENTFIPYAQTVTAAGHASIYTGSVPVINGILGNEWYDRQLGRLVYCVEDDSAKVVGGTAKSDPMSPKNLFTTTISDEMRLASNFKAKVVGVSIKDRGAILPAGHTGTAYWYESDNGSWITSSYYMNSLPKWVNDFNSRKLVDTFYSRNWNTMYPINTYTQSDADTVSYEGKSGPDKFPVFPHNLTSLMGKNYSLIRSTPYGNSFTLEFAKAALQSEQLGADNVTDMLAISLSSTDYVGHQYGPNSVEIEDTYLRLDKDLEDFFNFLDAKVGKGQYVFFLTADHGAAHVPAFLNKNKIDGKAINSNIDSLNAMIRARFGVYPGIIEFANYQLYLNKPKIDSAGKSVADISNFVIDELKKLPHVLTAFSYDNMANAVVAPEIKEMFSRGYNAKLAGDIEVVLKSGYFYGSQTGTTHGSWYPYDSHIPLVFMGWNITPGRTNRKVYMTDIAATIAAMLHIQMPSGCIGTPITEILPMR